METSVIAHVTPADPAKALLASQVLSDEELDGLVDSVCNPSIRKSRNRKDRIQTCVKRVDAVLGGGLESARIVCVSGAVASEICRTALVTSLLHHENSTAAIIDATGNFDVLRLYTLIVARLSSNADGIPDSLQTLLDPAKGVGIEEAAAIVLDRVKIMRVFDFEGVREAVSEIRGGLKRAGDKEVGINSAVEPVGREVEKIKSSEGEGPAEPEKARRTYVPDSEDEEDDEEDEMLFDTTGTTTTTTAAPPAQTAVPGGDPAPTLKPPGQEYCAIKFILIDSLAQVINPLLRKDYIQANAQSSSFLVSLKALTDKHNLYTLLANPTLPTPIPSPTRPPATNVPTPRQYEEPPPPPSVFASNTAVPALMGVLGWCTDVELLVERLPKRKGDARLLYREGGKKRGIEMVGVLEVVKDRWEGRTGAWAAFGESEQGIMDLMER